MLPGHLCGHQKPVRQWPLCIVWWCPRKHAGRVAKNAGWVRAGSEQATLWKTCHEALRRIALEATINKKNCEKKEVQPERKATKSMLAANVLQVMKQEMSWKIWRNLRHRVHRQKSDHRFAILQLHFWYSLMPVLDLEPEAIRNSKTSTYWGWRWRSCRGCSSTQDLPAGRGVFVLDNDLRVGFIYGFRSASAWGLQIKVYLNSQTFNLGYPTCFLWFGKLSSYLQTFLRRIDRLFGNIWKVKSWLDTMIHWNGLCLGPSLRMRRGFDGDTTWCFNAWHTLKKYTSIDPK